MTVIDLASWALDRRFGMSSSRSSTADPGGEPALRRQLARVVPASAVVAAGIAVAGAALGDRPSPYGALALVTAAALLPLLARRLTRRVRSRLDAAAAERTAFEAELAAVRRTSDELRGLAYHDDLTGLPNRSLLYDRLGTAIAHSLRQKSQFALLFLDIDDFKAVNDSLGHNLGDRLLVGIAARVRASIRGEDTVARVGGDEFVVLLQQVSGAEDAARVAGKLLHALQAPFSLDGHEVRVAVSLGVSVYPVDGTSAGELVGSADAAMYRDKQRESEPPSPCGPRRCLPYAEAGGSEER